MGELIPVFERQMIPTDIFKMSNRSLCRFMPMFAPEFTEINLYVHYFFVPYRLLAKYFPERYGTEEDVEAIITGGEGAFDPETMTNEVSDENFPVYDSITIPKGSIGDALGFPTGVALHDVPTYHADMIAIIYNEFYRNEVLQDLVTDLTLSSDLLVRNWAKDYFTSSLPTQQKGIAPALPLTGTSSAEWEENQTISGSVSGGSHSHTVTVNRGTSGSMMTSNGSALYAESHSGTVGTSSASPSMSFSGTISKDSLNANVVDFADAGTFDVSDIRNVFAIQRIMERANRCGSRYSEFIQANFGINPGDTRMQRPEYVGGSKSPIVVTQVLQNSASTSNSPQGNMAGHGIGYIGDRCGSYVAKEFGIMFGIASVMPKASYQQGIDREKKG